MAHVTPMVLIHGLGPRATLRTRNAQLRYATYGRSRLGSAMPFVSRVERSTPPARAARARGRGMPRSRCPTASERSRHSRFALDAQHRRRRTGHPSASLLDHELRVGEGRHLCQVRDDDDLVGACELGEPATDRVAVAPPMPASISSNTSVSTVSASPSTPLSASITRTASPPDAMRASGRAGCPAAGA